MTQFSYPLSPDERQQVAALLQARTTVVVGDYRLYADSPDGFIEADDAYGQPSCWSGDSAAEDALQWVDNQYTHDEAERAAFEADNGGPYIDYAAIAHPRNSL